MLNSIKARTPILALILFVFAVGYTVAATNKVVVIPLGADSVAPGSEVIRSGDTVTGVSGWNHAVIEDNRDVTINVQFPGRAPQILDDASINFAPHSLASDDDSSCTGSNSAPTAPAGKVCIYFGSTSAIDRADGYAVSPDTFADTGFKVHFYSNGTAGTQMFMIFTWAYTAP